ncbi:DUF1501 domain-containing protein [Viridibacterium curvum]|uniref:DUF1501 domain-containing protein n=1 Tax=Viridibacterium curvum TaxID=1101404 RepID=A0ABP9Q9R8_9RHOO
MDRRDFLAAFGAGAWVALSPGVALAQADRKQDWDRLLVLVELKGGNDGLNTIVPHADDQYYVLRPKLALSREQTLPLSEALGLNKAMAAVMPLWEHGQLAVVQGLGYPQPNLSHFRSIEIWDTASRSDEYLSSGWIARALSRKPAPKEFTADALVVGASDLGPVAGSRAITLAGNFERNARLANMGMGKADGALSHILKVEADVAHAARSLGTTTSLKTEFPTHEFGRTCRTACETLARSTGVAAMRLSIGSFDTHDNQTNRHALLLTQLAEGLAALRSALVEMGRWDESLVMTYAEFGRRPKENLSGGTDHGTVAPHFVMGGKVRGGLFGSTPSLNKLDESGNLPWQVDFRQLYATVLENWWGVPSAELLGGRFNKLPIV